MLTLKLGDKFIVPKGDILLNGAEVEIIELCKNATFMASGKDVIGPDKPRVMSAVVFANWIDGVNAERA